MFTKKIVYSCSKEEIENLLMESFNQNMTSIDIDTNKLEIEVCYNSIDEIIVDLDELSINHGSTLQTIKNLLINKNYDTLTFNVEEDETSFIVTYSLENLTKLIAEYICNFCDSSELGLVDIEQTLIYDDENEYLTFTKKEH